MSVYAVAQFRIDDRERYERYASGFMATLQPYHGKLLVADESPEVIEGDWRPDKVVIIEFGSAERFRAWVESPGYQAIVGNRREASTGSVVLVTGLAG